MVKILLADDHLVLRQGLKGLLEGYAEWSVVGEANDGFEVIPLVEEKEPDLIILDLSMPNLGGVEAIARMEKLDSPPTVLVLSAREDDLSVGDAVDRTGLFAEREDALYLGGPVAIETLSVLSVAELAPSGALRIVGDVSLINRQEDLETMIEADAPADSVRFYAGYAGWSPGQLEGEISRGVWHVVGGESRWVFSRRPQDTWRDLIRIFFGPRA